MVKKAKAKKATMPAKKRKRATKQAHPKKMSRRDRSIAERLHALGKTLASEEAFLKIQLEIDHMTGGGPALKVGEVGARIALAKRAWEDAILGSDDIKEWIAAARKAAGLPE